MKDGTNRICIVCKQNPLQGKQEKYCSRECTNKAKLLKMRELNNKHCIHEFTCNKCGVHAKKLGRPRKAL